MPAHVHTALQLLGITLATAKMLAVDGKTAEAIAMITKGNHGVVTLGAPAGSNTSGWGRQ